jgi:saccharopine dehydrogenase (NAD+, L-glutamate forming)
MPERDHDIVVFGATGFTGALTAQYLAENADPGTRWAIAGRSRQKLEDVRSRIGQPDLALIEADIGDLDSMRRLAESTKVLITTVGPYINYGEPVVAACAAAGTDYLDLTGEPEFVDLMWLRYHEQAEETGARLVHSCGFDSIPYDLGALFTVEQLPEGAPIELQSYMRAKLTMSGGTYHTTLHVLGRLRHSVRVGSQRREREPGPSGRRVRGVSGKPHQASEAGGWVVPYPTVDPQTVLRSARALDRYGPDFEYSLFFVVGKLPLVAGVTAGVGTLAALAQLEPARKLLGKLKAPGDGPSPEERAKAWFNLRSVGQADGQRVVTEVSGGDPGYGETSKMLSQSALCLAHDELPQTAGQVTPAVAMGDALIRRLQQAGIRFEVIEH